MYIKFKWWSSGNGDPMRMKHVEESYRKVLYFFPFALLALLSIDSNSNTHTHRGIDQGFLDINSYINYIIQTNKLYIYI